MYIKIIDPVRNIDKTLYYQENEKELKEWNSTRDIDNPLTPWFQKYTVSR